MEYLIFINEAVYYVVTMECCHVVSVRGVNKTRRVSDVSVDSIYTEG